MAISGNEKERMQSSKYAERRLVWWDFTIKIATLRTTAKIVQDAELRKAMAENMKTTDRRWNRIAMVW